MNEYYKNKLLNIDSNLYFLPDHKSFFEYINRDYQRVDLTLDGKNVDIKLRNFLLQKYKKKIKEAYYLKYGD